MADDTQFVDLSGKCWGVGQEIGWHLRFTRADTLEILVRPKLAEVLREEAAVVGIWDLAVRPTGGAVLGTFTRKRRG